ncbi:MAG: RagB/SusD family nutrient uptake outer membrane protein [Bacteroidetes bacterium]|nr:RagB/SusD family nutrient uptake outer membrane protein [Bacteroidota bacterium]
MKKSIVNKVMALALGLMFFAQSCTNLDEELYSDLAAENFFKSEAEYIAALGAAYSSFGGMGNHFGLWTMNELASDELVITTKGGDWYDGGVLIQLHEHNITIDNPIVGNTWNFLYGGVNTCNRLLYQFQQLPASDGRDATIAELRAIRALWYYWLLDSFGNVPVVTDFTDTEAPASKTRAEVYAFVEKELNETIPLLSTAKDGTTYGRINKWAALAVRCKLYLNAGVYTGTPQWQKAADDAQAIINSGKYSLESSYKSNFAVNNSGSNENIFVYPYDKVFAGGFNWPMMTLHYASQGVYNFTAQPWNGYSAVEEFYNTYVNATADTQFPEVYGGSDNPGTQGNVWKGTAIAPAQGTQDSRISNFVVGPQFNADGTRASDPGADSDDPDGAPLTFTPKINTIYPNGWRQGGARIGKYEYELGGTPNMSNDFVILRYADILLARAEALWQLNNGNAESLSLVNQIRSRAGVTPFAAPLTPEKLFAERGREMFAEMTRRQDLIRFGKFNKEWWAKNASDPKYKLFPIPKGARDVNPKLVQNPGYPN